MNKLLNIVLITLYSSNLSYGQVLDGVCIPSTSVVKKNVVSKFRYKFKPELNQLSSSQLTFYERFDSIGRIVEEKDINLDGTMYAWSFFKYDGNGNVIERKVMKGDSTLMYVETIKYDPNNRQIFRIGIEPDNKVRFQSNYIYQNDSVIYCGWYDDSSKVSTYIYQLDSTGKKINEIRYNGKDKVKFYESHFTYYDTILQQKREIFFTNGKITKEMEYEYDKDGNVLKEFYIDLNGAKHIKELTNYDLNGNKEYLKGFKDNNVSYVYRWQNEYDSLQRPTKTIKYCDTLGFKPYSTPLISVITYQYQVDYTGRRTEIKTTTQHSPFGDSSIIMVTVNYDSQGLWINTTETLNGVLTEYRYATYIYKEEP